MEFRLAIISDEVSQDPDVLIRVAREFHLEYVEIRSTNNKPPQALDKSEIKTLKDKLQKASLKCCGIDSPLFKCDIEKPDDAREHHKILEKCIALADALGTRLIRGFTFWRKPDLGKHWQSLLDHFEVPIRMIEKAGMTLGIENEHSTLIGTGRDLSRFLKQLNHPQVRAVWDPANSCHDEEGKETPYPDGYEAIKPWIAHIHVKDVTREKDSGRLIPARMGEGMIDYVGQFKALIQDNYPGIVSLETHWRPAVLSEEILNQPMGQGFSEGGEYASRLCLKLTRDLMDKARG